MNHRIDMAEAWTNGLLGAGISVALTHYWLGFEPVASVWITAVFFVVSTARSYVLRRVFRKLAA